MNLFNEIVKFATQTKNYKDALSDFIIGVTSKMGGGLPQQYFNDSELAELENIFKKVYDANKDLTNMALICSLDLSCRNILEIPVIDCLDKDEPFVKTIGEALSIEKNSNYQSELIVKCKNKYFIFFSSMNFENGFKSRISENTCKEYEEEILLKFDESDCYDKAIIDRIQEYFYYPIEVYLAEA